MDLDFLNCVQSYIRHLEWVLCDPCRQELAHGATIVTSGSLDVGRVSQRDFLRSPASVCDDAIVLAMMGDHSQIQKLDVMFMGFIHFALIIEGLRLC